MHEAASALKALLGGLEEPLLTDLCFQAVTCLGRKDRNYWLPGLRLLLQVFLFAIWNIKNQLWDLVSISGFSDT